MLRVDDHLSQPVEHERIRARFVLGGGISESEIECHDGQHACHRRGLGERLHRPTPPSPKSRTISRSDRNSYSDRRDSRNAPKGWRLARHVAVSQAGRFGCNRPKSIASQVWHRIVRIVPTLSRTARNAVSAPSEWTKPSPIGPPGERGFSVTGTSQRRMAPALQTSRVFG